MSNRQGIDLSEHMGVSSFRGRPKIVVFLLVSIKENTKRGPPVKYRPISSTDLLANSKHPATSGSSCEKVEPLLKPRQNIGPFWAV